MRGEGCGNGGYSQLPPEPLKPLSTLNTLKYVDGYNLYYSLREKGWKRFYWLNIQAMVRHLLKPDQMLVTTKYFTTIIKRPEDKRRRKAAFLEALQTLNNFQISVLSRFSMVKPDVKEPTSAKWKTG